MSKLLKRAAIAPIRFYQKNVSPYRPRCCRFYPTCSAYAVEAIEKRGVLAGSLLAGWRLLRCNPFGGSGYDPVPEKGFRRTKRGGNDTEE